MNTDKDESNTNDKEEILYMDINELFKDEIINNVDFKNIKEESK